MSVFVNDAGTLREVKEAYVNDAGTLRQLSSIDVNDAGTLRSVPVQAKFYGTMTSAIGGTGAFRTVGYSTTGHGYAHGNLTLNSNAMSEFSELRFAKNFVDNTTLISIMIAWEWSSGNFLNVGDPYPIEKWEFEGDFGNGYDEIVTVNAPSTWSHTGANPAVTDLHVYASYNFVDGNTYEVRAILR